MNTSLYIDSKLLNNKIYETIATSLLPLSCKIPLSEPDPSGHDWDVLWFSIIHTLSSANIRDHDNDRYS